MNPKILFIDIETQPDLVYTWGVYEQDAIAVKEHWQVLSFSAEWYGGKKITKGLCDYKGYKPGCTDKELIADVWELLNEADIVIAHNGISFDLKKLTARFIACGLTPPAPYSVVDTRREIARVAGFSSNKLDWLAKQLDLGSKLQHEGFPMWIGCMAGDKRCWRKMKEYNRHDVVLLKKLYKLISPWIKQPNANIFASGNKPKWDVVCPNPICKSTNMKSGGWRRNKTRRYRQYVCKDCGSWCSDTKSDVMKAKVQ